MSEIMSESSVKLLPHHVQQPLCTTRERYRQGRKLTAIKVYTVNDESRHLLIHGVPSIAIHDELETLCKKFGELEKFVKLTDYPREEFTDVYQVSFKRLPTARFAKRQLDNKNYFGGILHVCYAPELESLDDTRAKLLDRRKAIELRTSNGSFSQTKRQNTRSLKRNVHQDLQLPRAKRPAFQNEIDFNNEPSLVSEVSLSHENSKPIIESLISPSVPENETTSVKTSSFRLVPRQVSIKRIVFKQPKTSQSSSSNDPGSVEKKKLMTFQQE